MGNVVFHNELRQKSSSEDRCLIGVMYEENFGDLLPYIRDVEVTDINWNGKDLWIDDVSRGRYCAGIQLKDEFIEAFCIRVADVVGKTFNKYYPRLEAETEDLRITIIHKSVSQTGTIISIRKTPIVKRISFAKSIKEDYYCPEEVANILSNSVKAKFNIVIGGLPGVGKTELVKYLTNYIFPRDRVITIEDTTEIHYSKINPNKDCVEMKVDEKVFTYTDAIKSCLRLLPQWILLSEARSKEVRYLLESISTGAKCITTIHTDDMRKVPKRVVNMTGDMDNSKLAESMAYSYFDLGILIDKTQDTVSGKISRFIAQIVMYCEEKGENKCVVLYNRGKFTDAEIPEELMQQYNRMGIADPWKYTFIEDTKQVADDITGFLDDEGAEEGMSVVDDTTGLSGNSTSRYIDEEDEASGNIDEMMGSDFEEVSEDAEDEEVEVFEGIPTEGFSETPEDDATGVMPENGEEEPTDFVGDEVENDDEPTGFISEVAEVEVDSVSSGVSFENSTSEEVDEGSEDETSFVEGDSDSESKTGFMEEVVTDGNQDDDGSESETGFMEDVDGSEDETGFMETKDSTPEEITSNLENNADNMSPAESKIPKSKRRGKRGRR